MVTRIKSPAYPRPEQVCLLEPVALAKAKLADRIRSGGEIRALPIGFRADLDAAQSEFHKWDDYNRELLTHLFTADRYAKAYCESAMSVGFQQLSQDLNGNGSGLSEKTAWHLRTIDLRIKNLQSLYERLEVIPECPDVQATTEPAQQARQPNDFSRVFVVHGHDEAAQLKVARFIETLDLKPIILHEQANKGRTLIEKFEANANVGFAVVILTADDEGRARGVAETKNRARQNVIFEWGFFIGKLGREKVCALYDGVEKPSDVDGVAWVSLDKAGAWKMGLVRELKAAGYRVDANRLLG